MTMRLSNRVRSASANAAVDEIDVGTGDAVLELWSGSRPGSVGGTPSGDLLASFDLPDPAFGAAADGVATANSIDPTVGVAAGTVGFAQVLDQDGTVLWDNDNVGTSGTQIVLNTTTISVGVNVEVLSWTVTMPAGA